MSFSFNARGANKAEALKAVAAEMAKVVEGQPIHQHDAEAVNKTAELYVGMLADDADRDIIVGCNGWLMWEGADTPTLTNTSISVSARIINRE